MVSRLQNSITRTIDNEAIHCASRTAHPVGYREARHNATRRPEAVSDDNEKGENDL